MLILARKKDQSIILNGDIEITVVDIDKNGNVKLGIKAPKNVSILRKELYQEIQESNKEAIQETNKMVDLKTLKGILKNNPL